MHELCVLGVTVDPDTDEVWLTTHIFLFFSSSKHSNRSFSCWSVSPFCPCYTLCRLCVAAEEEASHICAVTSRRIRLFGRILPYWSNSSWCDGPPVLYIVMERTYWIMRMPMLNKIMKISDDPIVDEMLQRWFPSIHQTTDLLNLI